MSDEVNSRPPDPGPAENPGADVTTQMAPPDGEPGGRPGARA